MRRTGITYAIVEDDTGYRNALVAQLARHAGIRCAGQWEDAGKCRDQIDRVAVEVLLVDLRLGKDSGVDLIRAVTANKAAPLVIALTVEEGSEFILQAIEAGAVGYLLKRASAGEIVTAMRQAVAGESPLSGVIARRLLTEIKGRQPTKTATTALTRREREILEAMAGGLYYKEVAEQLHIAEGTVRAHIFRIYRKLQVSSREEALQKTGRWMKRTNSKTTF